MDKDILKEITTLRQMGEMMVDKATALEKKLGLVSSPTARKGKRQLADEEVQKLAFKIATKRRNFLLNKFKT